MKKFILCLLALVSIHLSATEPLKIGVITDIHYLSEKLMDKGYTINDYVYNSGKNVISTPEVLDQVLQDYLDSNITVLLISGDLTKDGEKQSHLDLRDKLRPLYDKGVQIFVVPGNHDINMPNALKYQGNKTFKTENITVKDFKEIYANYGFNQATEKDGASLSYLAPLDESTYLLTIDAARYEYYTNTPIIAGRVKPETESWIVEILNKAKAENKQVIAMMHWGLAEHIPYQSAAFPNYLVHDNKRIATLLADNGVKVIFTGHFHSNDITQFDTVQGNRIYDIETGALVSYPYAYRMIELADGKMQIKTKNVTSTASYPNLAEESKENMKRIASTRALPMIKKLGFEFPEQYTEQLAQIAGELFILHLYGDEKVSPETKKQLMDIFIEMGFPVDTDMNNLQLDLFPADNNLTIDIH